MTSLLRIAFFLFLINLPIKSKAKARFTNIKCESLDKTFCEFTKCELKVLGRGIIGCNIHLKMLKLPLNQLTFIATIHKKFNGYRPFVYNLKVDYCDFMTHPKRYPWFLMIHNAIRNFSNLNHSCPINENIIISKMILKDEMFAKVPLPNGNYKQELIGITKKKLIGKVEVFFDWERL